MIIYILIHSSLSPSELTAQGWQVSSRRMQCLLRPMWLDTETHLFTALHVPLGIRKCCRDANIQGCQVTSASFGTLNIPVFHHTYGHTTEIQVIFGYYYLAKKNCWNIVYISWFLFLCDVNMLSAIHSSSSHPLNVFPQLKTMFPASSSQMICHYHPLNSNSVKTWTNLSMCCCSALLFLFLFARFPIGFFIKPN